MSRVVIDLRRKEMSVGLTYVQLIHVKTLEGLVFQPTFDFNRLKKSGVSAMERSALELQLQNIAIQINSELGLLRVKRG